MLLTYILFTGSFTFYATNIFNKDILKERNTELISERLNAYSDRTFSRSIVNAWVTPVPFMAFFSMLVDFLPVMETTLIWHFIRLMLYIISVQLSLYGTHRMLHKDEDLYKYHSQFHLHPLNGISAFAGHPVDFAVGHLIPVMLSSIVFYRSRILVALTFIALNYKRMCIDHNIDEAKSAHYRIHHESENCNFGHPRIDLQFKTHDSQVNVHEETRETPPSDPNWNEKMMNVINEIERETKKEEYIDNVSEDDADENLDIKKEN